MFHLKVLLESGTFLVSEGQQGDAEEFLGHLLDTLHVEMCGLIKLAEEQHQRLQQVSRGCDSIKASFC